MPRRLANIARPPAVFNGLLILAVVLGACQNGGENGDEDTPEPAPTPTPVPLEGEATIYVAAPLSGPHAASGQAQAAGARLAADRLNRVGGLQGREINIKTVNDLGNADGAQDAAEQIVEAARAGEEIAGVVAFGGSDPGLESVSGGYLGGDGLDSLVVIPASDEPVTGQVDDPRFFQLSAPVVSQSRQVAAVMRERNLKNVALVHGDSEYGRGLAEEFESASEELGVGTAATFEISPGEVTYSEQVSQVREMNPSGLFFAAEDEEAAVFLSELFGFEFQGSVIGANKSLSYNLVDRLGCQAEGLSFASVLPSPESTMSAELLSQYEEQEGRAPDRHTVAGYSAVEFITRAYDEAGSLDAGDAASAARGSDIQTLMGNVAFDSQGNLMRPRIHFFQVQGRQLRHQFTREVGEGPRVPEGQQGDGGTLLDLPGDGQEPIVFAGLDWDSARFANTVARLIIEAGYGYPTESTAGSSVPLFQSLRQGDVDVYLETWLPNAQELYDNALDQGQIEDLGLFYGDAEQGWYVPRYVVDGDPDRGIEAMAPDLQSVEDLERYREVFATDQRPGTGQLMDGSPGWFSYKIDCMKLKAYRLDDSYAQVTTGSESALFSALEEAHEAGEPILTYVFEPTWPMAEFDLVKLEEPPYDPQQWQENKGVAFPDSQIKKVVFRDFRERAPEVTEFLEQVSLSTDRISEILLTMHEEEVEPQDAAQQWMEDNTDTWTSWVPDDVAERVEEQLQ